jgi:uncharacterized Zn finger protein (UPF0148 family)
MSDFDKEAERERLREKYERDEQKRESTRRMSELLLKGATMTNRHCDACGDPIFRWNGQEFCPTCQATGDADGVAAVEGEAAAEAEPATGADATGVEGESGDAGDAAAESTTVPVEGVDSAGGGTDAGEGTATAPAGTDADPASGGDAGTDSGASAAGTRRPTPTPTRVDDEPSTAGEAESTRSAAPSTAGDELDGARASLVRTLSAHADAAEAASDPRRAREHLAVAREAAETLAALRR